MIRSPRRASVAAGSEPAGLRYGTASHRARQSSITSPTRTLGHSTGWLGSKAIWTGRRARQAASAPGRPDPDPASQKQQAAVSTGLPSGSFCTTREKKTLPAAHSEPRETAAAAFVTLSVRLVAMSGAAHTDLDAVGDKAFISAPLATRLWADNRVHLITLPRRNARQPASPPLRRLVNGARQIIETVISQLTEQFHIEVNHVQSFWGLTARLQTKLAAHTLCVYLNRLQR
jgi:hypothetical protein